MLLRTCQCFHPGPCDAADNIIYIGAFVSTAVRPPASYTFPTFPIRFRRGASAIVHNLDTLSSNGAASRQSLLWPALLTVTMRSLLSRVTYDNSGSIITILLDSKLHNLIHKRLLMRIIARTSMCCRSRTILARTHACRHL